MFNTVFIDNLIIAVDPLASRGMESLGPAVRIRASDVASVHRSEIKKAVDALSKKGIVPRIVGFLATENPEAKSFAELTSKICQSDGIVFEIRIVNKLDIETAIELAIRDQYVHGIMVYYPCFGAAPSFYGGSMDGYLQDCLPVEKDVEGLCHVYRHHLYHNIRFIDTEDVKFPGGIPRLVDNGTRRQKKSLQPCTALAVVKIIEHVKVYDEALPVGDRLRGRCISVVNRSEIMGRPLAAMLANDGADVFSIDARGVYLMRRGKILETTESQEELIKRSSVIITGVPKKDYRLPTEWVQPGTLVINVSHFKNADEEAIMKIPGVKYVSSVGKVTVAMLERNLIRLIDNFHTSDLYEI